jgi:ABC-type sulfate transport system substrate-binding protein
MKNRKAALSFIVSIGLMMLACLPSGPTETKGGETIKLYGFSIMKEVMEKDIFPAFAAKWKSEYGGDVGFVSSFAGSETVTNQILQGTPADVAILSIDRDAARLAEAAVDAVAPPEQGHRQQNAVRNSRSQGKSERDQRLPGPRQTRRPAYPSRSVKLGRCAVVDPRDLWF